MKPLKLAYLSLIRHRTSTGIAIMAIALSVASAGTLLRLHELSQSRFAAMGEGGDAIVGAKAGGIEILLSALNGEGDFPDFLPYRLFESLRGEQAVTHGDGVTTRPTYIQSITPFAYFAEYQNYRVIGTDSSFFKRLGLPPPSLSMGEVVVGASVAKSHHLKVGDTVIVRPWVGEGNILTDVPLRVSAILAASQSVWDKTLFSSVEQAHQVYERNLNHIHGKSIWGANVLHYFLIDLEPGGFVDLETLVNRRTVGQAIHIKSEAAKLKSLTTAGTSVGFFVSTFIMLLGGLCVAAMLITRFEGMSLQIAVLRAIGYSRLELSGWLVWEGVLLAVMGVALGIILDLSFFPLLRNALGGALPDSGLVQISISKSAVVWLAAVCATLAAVLIPVLKMLRQDVHQLLKD